MERAAKMLARVVIRKAAMSMIIKDAKAFDALMLSLKNAYTRAWKSEHQKAIADALDTMRAMPSSRIARFGPAEANKIMKALEGKVGGAAMRSALNGPVVKLSEPLYALGFKELGDAGVDIKFGLADKDALKVVKNSNLFWVGEHWNAFTKEKFDDILGEYFDKGLTREQMAKRMAVDFASLGNRGDAYWDLLADHTGTKTRELGRADAYMRTGVKYIQVRAHIDSRTTEICKALNGQIISVERLAEQKNKYLDAVGRKDAEAAKDAWPMMTDKHAEKIATGKIPNNVGSPPYHFRCRTITVVHFGGGPV